MHRRKLLTVACALGVLACGACFLPPLREPPPPLPPSLAAVRTIAVQIEDSSAHDLIHEAPMSAAVASNFNRLWAEFPVRALPYVEAGRYDAVLKVTIIQKTVSGGSTSHGNQLWTFEILASLALTASDGRILQSETNQRSRFGFSSKIGLAPGTWNSAPIRNQAAYALAMTVGDRLLFVPSSQ
jgi:hypothetical protein